MIQAFNQKVRAIEEKLGTVHDKEDSVNAKKNCTANATKGMVKLPVFCLDCFTKACVFTVILLMLMAVEGS